MLIVPYTGIVRSKTGLPKHVSKVSQMWQSDKQNLRKDLTG